MPAGIFSIAHCLLLCAKILMLFYLSDYHNKCIYFMLCMALNEIKSIENINQNPQSFQRTSRMQKEVHSSWRLQHRKWKWQNPIKLKEDNPTEKMLKSIEPSKSVPYKARTWDIDLRKYWLPTKLQRRPRILIKLSFG